MTTEAAPGIATWAIDSTHSIAEFGVKHMMISTVKGRFGVVSGTIQFDGTNHATGSVEATIDVASITTNEEARDNHLRSADFFDAANHPSMTFRSSKTEHVRDDEYKVHGDLTIRGTTRPVVLDTVFEGSVTDPWGNQRLGFTAETSINRKEFGLTWGQLLETGGAVVGDKVKVTLHIEAVRQG